MSYFGDRDVGVVECREQAFFCLFNTVLRLCLKDAQKEQVMVHTGIAWLSENKIYASALTTARPRRRRNRKRFLTHDGQHNWKCRCQRRTHIYPSWLSSTIDQGSTLFLEVLTTKIVSATADEQGSITLLRVLKTRVLLCKCPNSLSVNTPCVVNMAYFKVFTMKTKKIPIESIAFPFRITDICVTCLTVFLHMRIYWQVDLQTCDKKWYRLQD